VTYKVKARGLPLNRRYKAFPIKISCGHAKLKTKHNNLLRLE
jgi:hypothetical protein